MPAQGPARPARNTQAMPICRKANEHRLFTFPSLKFAGLERNAKSSALKLIQLSKADKSNLNGILPKFAEYLQEKTCDADHKNLIVMIRTLPYN